jgi:hypothetical protein
LIASTHLALGAASGLLVQKIMPDYLGLPERIAAGFSLGLLTHIVADALPHREYMVVENKFWVVVALEILAILFLVYYPLRGWVYGLVMFSALAGAAFPDFLSIFYEYLAGWEWIRNWDNYLHKYHGKVSIGFKVSLVQQVLLAVGLMLLVKFVPP